MRRREFIALLGSTATVPFAARAQQADRMRRIGVLTPQAESDPVARSWITAFSTRLRELGWTEGKNAQIDYRYGANDATRLAPFAKELVELRPDVILAITNSSAAALRQYTLAIPIVFTMVGDPVVLGLIANLARPNGNTTGFNSFEFSIASKWIELLQECTPGLTRVAVFFDPSSAPWTGYMRAIETAAAALGVQLMPHPVQRDAEIERAFAGFATQPHGALIALPTTAVVNRRDRIIALAAQYRLPAMYPYRFFAAAGGLMSYGSDSADQHKQAASYVDRILKGEKPADLPVQQPTKFELIVNLNTAKALGLTVPQSVLTRADEVIE